MSSSPSAILGPVSVGSRPENYTSTRFRLPDERPGKTREFTITSEIVGGLTARHKLFIRTGENPDGSLGEVFVVMDKTGSSTRGFIDAFATALSIGLQHGVPLETFVEKFKGFPFEPSGETGSEFGRARSPIDLVCRWLDVVYIQRRAQRGSV